MSRFVLIDEDRLMKEFAGDEEILAELCVVFEAELPKMLGSIETAIQSKEMDSLERCAHTLKGAVANFHAPLVKEAAMTLEKQGRERDFENIQVNFEKLKKVLDELRQELNRLVKHAS